MKKREVKPFLDIETKDTIYKLSFATGRSIKSICEDFCRNSFKNGLGYELSHYFCRNVAIDGTTFEGNPSSEKFEPFSSEIERVTMTLNADEHEYAYNLSYAIGCSVSKVVSYAIEKSMNDYEFLNRYAKEYLIDNSKSEKSLPLIKIFESFINDSEEEFNLISLLLFIADEYTRMEIGIDDVLKDCVSN